MYIIRCSYNFLKGTMLYLHITLLLLVVICEMKLIKDIYKGRALKSLS